ncbi:uncharacterized protein ARMOST_07626 [Armillaria ostoyae]|uniref:Uncharacterized protein n=1 Tax=Armillaria ostoyae TaxID=47428 RepID=A0A284R6C7_ARMOS|nr:uncharacterized protein ARMOST_07626 [Armillaria ostoyae]
MATICERHQREIVLFRQYNIDVILLRYLGCTAAGLSRTIPQTLGLPSPDTVDRVQASCLCKLCPAVAGVLIPSFFALALLPITR